MLVPTFPHDFKNRERCGSMISGSQQYFWKETDICIVKRWEESICYRFVLSASFFPAIFVGPQSVAFSSSKVTVIKMCFCVCFRQLPSFWFFISDNKGSIFLCCCHECRDTIHLIGEGHSAIEMKIPVPADRNASPFYKR